MSWADWVRAPYPLQVRETLASTPVLPPAWACTRFTDAELDAEADVLGRLAVLSAPPGCPWEAALVLFGAGEGPGVDSPARP